MRGYRDEYRTKVEERVEDQGPYQGELPHILNVV